jgi:hypothetical protein
MNIKETILQLKEAFNDLVNVSPTSPVALMDMTLVDGTAIQITEMVVGGIVSMNGTPAPAGEYELSDGTYMTIGDNGAIMEIKPMADVAVEPVAPEMMSSDFTAKFAAFETSTAEKFNSYEAKFALYEERLSKATKVIEGLISITKTLADTPTGVADASIKTTNSFEVEPKVKNYDLLFN